MAHVNIERLSLSFKDREKEEQKKAFRKKSLLVLVYQFLRDGGYVLSSDCLRNEAKFPLDDFDVCDNIHLESLLQDFETYYFLRYQKIPRIVKKNSGDNQQTTSARGRVTRTMKSPLLDATRRSVDSARNDNNKNQPGRLLLGDNELQSFQAPQKDTTQSLNASLSSRNQSARASNCFTEYVHVSNTFSESVCSPNSPMNEQVDVLDCFEGHQGSLESITAQFVNRSPEWKAMASIVMQDFVAANRSKVSDVIGHDRAKQLLKEAALFPLKYRELFPGSASAWKSVLLYGPTGTGKTLLASAVAAQSPARLFKVATSTLVSKWRGESEKLMRVLFEVATLSAPSIVFMDEMDALLSARGGDHEASRRAKTEFFMQMDKLSSSNEDAGFVLVIGATNTPWELDSAVLRRMEKRVLVPLPGYQDRVELFRKFLVPFLVAEGLTMPVSATVEYETLAEASGGYSSADIETVCKEAKMGVVRKVFDVLESHGSGGKSGCCEDSGESCVGNSKSSRRSGWKSKGSADSDGSSVEKSKLYRSASKSKSSDDAHETSVGDSTSSSRFSGRKSKLSADANESLVLSSDSSHHQSGQISKNSAGFAIENSAEKARMHHSGLKSDNSKSHCGGSRDSTGQTVVIDSLTTEDVLAAMKLTKPAASDLMQKYEEWRDKHGSE